MDANQETNGQLIRENEARHYSFFSQHLGVNQVARQPDVEPAHNLYRCELESDGLHCFRGQGTFLCGEPSLRV